MDVKLDGGIYVSLSERNLRDLVAQYELNDYASLHRNVGGALLHIRVEEDAKHYGDDRVPGPGSGLA